MNIGNISVLLPGSSEKITFTSLFRLFLNGEGRFLFSAALWDLENSRPVHSLMLSSYLFFCLLCNRLPFTMPCKMVLARPDERETCP